MTILCLPGIMPIGWQGQVDRVERIDLQDTGHALHHARAEQVATAIDAFAARLGRKAR